MGGALPVRDNRTPSAPASVARGLDALPSSIARRVVGVGPCWVWTGYVHPSGYAWARPPRGTRGASWFVHRFAYEAVNGPVPRGLVLDHLCRVRACIRPDHLEPVTSGENCRRGIGPAALNARKTHCRRGHSLAGDNLLLWSDGRRRCAVCTRDWYAARDNARRQALRAGASR